MGHCKGGPHMESAKQERKNLLDINPIAKHASGGSWMSKHSKSAMHMGHSPAEMGHSPAEMGHDSPAKNTETPAERKARLRKENAKKLAKGKANLARLKAESKAPKKETEKLTGVRKLARSIYNQFADNDPRN